VDHIHRPSQSRILQYTSGRLGIAAVPGAGKTHILSALAAQIIQRHRLEEGQEVLIVTLVNAAVDNFEARIRQFFDRPLLALYKYRVRTLHGLAHDIVREKPARVGLEQRFSIVDEREAELIRSEAVRAWLGAHAGALDGYLLEDLQENQRRRVRTRDLPELLGSLANAFIRSAKDHRMTPDVLQVLLDRAPAPLPLAAMGAAIYSDYQRALAYRGAVDFDDLIRLALDLLENDEEYLERLRYRYPFILEDEAQDSSLSQEAILSLLAGEDGNWVRVGDPNQAIFETFTTASPELLRAFISENPSQNMPESGRSQPAIIRLANQLIDWVMQEHQVEAVRDALSPPHIQPVPEGDPQPNPVADLSAVHFAAKKYTPEEETEAVVKSIQQWLPEHEDQTVAVLVPRNTRGVEVINALRSKKIETIELLASTSNTRAAAGALNDLLAYLSDPQSAHKLSGAYQVWRREVFGADGQPGAQRSKAAEGARRPGRALAQQASSLLRKLTGVEDYLAPRPDHDWLAELGLAEADPLFEQLGRFRVTARRWLDAVTLPIDQLVLTLAQDVFFEPSDLALAHKFALVLRQAADDHDGWRLPELTSELSVIARNERRFIGFSSDDAGFDPERHRGKVVVTTMHKAKGLEWDRVYLMSVNNYDFPSAQPVDRYISEKWFIRDSLNLEAEALAQLRALRSAGEFDWYEEGAATRRARLEYVRERLRLLYVGITRARRDLIITWNSGRTGDAQPSLAMQALRGWWEAFSSA